MVRQQQVYIQSDNWSSVPRNLSRWLERTDFLVSSSDLYTCTCMYMCHATYTIVHTHTHNMGAISNVFREIVLWCTSSGRNFCTPLLGKGIQPLCHFSGPQSEVSVKVRISPRVPRLQLPMPLFTLLQMLAIFFWKPCIHSSPHSMSMVPSLQDLLKCHRHPVGLSGPPSLLLLLSLSISVS